MNKNNLLEKQAIVSDLSFSSSLQYNFVMGYKGDTGIASIKIEEKTCINDLADRLTKYISEAINLTNKEMPVLQTFNEEAVYSVMGVSTISSVVFVEFGKICLGYYTIVDSSLDVDYALAENPFFVKKGKFEVQFVMDRYLLRNVLKIVNDRIRAHKTATINWHFIHDGRQSVQEIPVENPYDLYDEFYPYIKYGPNKQFGAKQLIQDFIDSDESILLMLGPPGTGKTSFIRHMICGHNFHACMTYDKNVFTKDKFYIDYMLGEQTDLMIVEDADVLLEARETAGNEDMSKLLNVGDGLVKIMNKKIIFTANLTNSNKIDEAIMRPGRCFGVVNFRNLTQKEADVVCDIAKLAPISGKTEYSLAEIFSRKEQNEKIRKFGFV